MPILSCLRRSARVRVLLVSVLLPGVALAEDCVPKRNCDATRDCSLQVDTRSCGHDVDWGLLGKHHINDPFCELAKAAQNRGYEIAKAACETQKAAEKFDFERVKTQMRVACELGLDGPFSCSAGEVLGQLRTSPQEGLTDFEELSGAISTPIKKLGGQLSWRETACSASGTAIPYRNSQRSTDDFCTLDVQLITFSIDGNQKPTGDRFLRLEVLPGSRASQVCASRTISTRDRIRFGGPVKIDKHFPGNRWLEVHVSNDFDIISDATGDSVPHVPSNSPEPQAGSYTVRKDDCLS